MGGRKAPNPPPPIFENLNPPLTFKKPPPPPDPPRARESTKQLYALVSAMASMTSIGPLVAGAEVDYRPGGLPEFSPATVLRVSKVDWQGRVWLDLELDAALHGHTTRLLDRPYGYTPKCWCFRNEPQ